VRRDFSSTGVHERCIDQPAHGGYDVLSPINPYRGKSTQVGDITFGNRNLQSLLAQKGAYYQKPRQK
jgi:hypothetical protein